MERLSTPCFAEREIEQARVILFSSNTLGNLSIINILKSNLLLLQRKKNESITNNALCS